ncbi:MAG: hypothetical protein K2X93_20295 [Candidatus Obscuribacterales bacterium]|nr:hypothetical protein [Candidatus Obscuribacterales bacterium]
MAKTNLMLLRAQPWLSSLSWDSMLIIAPAFLSAFVALIFKAQLDNSQYMPLWAWVSFVLVVDVAHVYATLFRTYLDKRSFSENKPILLLIPAACWFSGWILYSLDDIYFWRALAYLAVFHFIRQQYGFVALYSRKDPQEFAKAKWFDYLTVYTVTLFPLLYWHTHLPRNFHWFIKGDFVSNVPASLAEAGFCVYVAVCLGYVVKELVLLRKTGFLNLPKNLIVGGTAFSWWVGIVTLNSDLAFTMTNVLTHGIPYMALIWLYHYKKRSDDIQVKGTADSCRRHFSFAAVRDIALTFAPAFVLFLVMLAYLEEGLWDGFVWREHLTFFSPFSGLPTITDAAILAVLVPLLSLPQSTHYVLDGFIWRVKDKTSSWSAIR